MFNELYSQTVSSFADAPDRFEMAVRAAYEAILGPGDVAVDVGAHTGKHTIPLGRAVSPSGRVYAFEPIAEKYVRLIENIISTKDIHVYGFNACVGESSGVTTFVYLPEDPGKSSTNIRTKFLTDSRIMKSERCSAVLTLDECLAKENGVRFIKIDVEGSELSVLKGARQTIERCRPIVHVEVGVSPLSAHGVTPLSIYRLFASMSYGMIDIIGTTLTSEEMFMSSVEAGSVYDYFAYPTETLDGEVVAVAAAAAWARGEA